MFPPSLYGFPRSAACAAGVPAIAMRQAEAASRIRQLPGVVLPSVAGPLSIDLFIIMSPSRKVVFESAEARACVA